MDALADLFATNRIVVLSVYGQVFFVLGLAIALQSLKRSTLPLARSLPWLAAFGILHGLHEWGYLFVPIQSGYLPAAATEALLLLQLAIKGISFALLLQFGISLVTAIRAPDGRPRLNWVAAGLLVAWAAATVLVSAAVGPYQPEGGPWLAEGRIDEALAAVGAPLAVGDVLARWMLGLPGALLAAWGLAASASGVRALARPSVVAGLRTASLAFAAYAVVAGMLGMPAPFAPASALNGSTVTEALGVPIEVLRSVAGLVIAVAIIVALDLFEQETDRALAEARRTELLARERERIGRDLHDGVIQSIYAAGLHLDAVGASLEQEPEASRAGIRRVMGELDRTIGEIRGYITGLEVEGGATDPAAVVAAVAAELDVGAACAFEMDAGDDPLPAIRPAEADELRHLVREVLSNALRHGRPTRIAARVRFDGTALHLRIADDGTGFDPAAPAAPDARGMANMRRRAELLGASLTVESDAARGTSVSLTMPVATVGRTR